MTGEHRPTDLRCETVDEWAAEYALGLLDGEPRAALIAHLDGCPRCRAAVTELAETADAVLLVAPGAEPPADFEQRVLASIGDAPATAIRRPDRSARGRGRGRVVRTALLAAAAAVLAIALVSGGIVVGRSSRTETATASVQGRSGQTIGRVVVTHGEPAWMFLAMQGGSVQGAYGCELVLADGSVVQAGEFDSGDGKAEWAGSIPVDPNDIREMRVTLPDGRVVASANFS